MSPTNKKLQTLPLLNFLYVRNFRQQKHHDPDHRGGLSHALFGIHTQRGFEAVGRNIMNDVREASGKAKGTKERET